MNLADKVVKESYPKKCKEKASTGTSLHSARFFTLSGFIRDISSGEVLIGAGISLPGTSTGTTSNEYGFYSCHE